MRVCIALVLVLVGCAMERSDVSGAVTQDVHAQQKYEYKQDLLSVLARRAVIDAWLDKGIAWIDECEPMMAAVIVQHAPNEIASKLCGSNEIPNGQALYGCYMSSIHRITVNSDVADSPYKLSKTLAHEFVHALTYCVGAPDDEHSNPELWHKLSNESVETSAMINLGLYVVDVGTE